MIWCNQTQKSERLIWLSCAADEYHCSIDKVLNLLEPLTLPNATLSEQENGRIITALCRLCVCSSELFRSRTASIIMRLYLKQRDIAFLSNELTIVLTFLGESLSVPSDTLLLDDILGAIYCLIKRHGCEKEFLPYLSTLLPVLLQFSEGSVDIYRRSLAVAALMEICAQNWNTIDIKCRGTLCLCLSTNVASHFRLLQLRMPEVKLSLVCACSIKKILESCHGSVDLIAVYFPSLVLSLSHLIQPLIAETHKQKQPVRLNKVFLDPLELNFMFHADHDGKELMSALRLHAIYLLTTLVKYLPKLFHAHWGMFIVYVPTSFFKPKKFQEIDAEYVSGNVAHEGDLLDIMNSDTCIELRIAASNAIQMMVSNAPFKLWISNPTVYQAHTNKTANSLYVKASSMMTRIQQQLCISIAQTSDVEILSSLCHCANSIIIAVPHSTYPSTNFTLLDESLCEILLKLGFHMIYNGLHAYGSSSIALLACHTLLTAFSQLPAKLSLHLFLEKFTFEIDEPYVISCDFISCLLILAKKSKLRTDSLVLLAKISLIIPYFFVEKVERDTSESVRKTLQLCFNDSDQNIRLHSLKVLAAILKKRYDDFHTGKFEIYNSLNKWIVAGWDSMVEVDLRRSLKDPFHGVRAVGCNCHMLLLLQDWERLELESRSSLIILATQDESSDVGSAACKVIGQLLVIMPFSNAYSHLSDTLISALLSVLESLAKLVSCTSTLQSKFTSVIGAILQFSSHFYEQRFQSSSIQLCKLLKLAKVLLSMLNQDTLHNGIAVTALGYLVSLLISHWSDTSNVLVEERSEFYVAVEITNALTKLLLLFIETIRDDSSTGNHLRPVRGKRMNWTICSLCCKSLSTMLQANSQIKDFSCFEDYSMNMCNSIKCTFLKVLTTAINIFIHEPPETGCNPIKGTEAKERSGRIKAVSYITQGLIHFIMRSSRFTVELDFFEISMKLVSAVLVSSRISGHHVAYNDMIILSAELVICIFTCIIMKSKEKLASLYARFQEDVSNSAQSLLLLLSLSSPDESSRCIGEMAATKLCSSWKEVDANSDYSTKMLSVLNISSLFHNGQIDTNIGLELNIQSDIVLAAICVSLSDFFQQETMNSHFTQGNIGVVEIDEIQPFLTISIVNKFKRLAHERTVKIYHHIQLEGHSITDEDEI